MCVINSQELKDFIQRKIENNFIIMITNKLNPSKPIIRQLKKIQ